MALVPCPECQKEVSTEARVCPQCAYPFPGKKVLQEGHPVLKLNSCPQCDGPLSQHAQACPHCGASFIEKRGDQENHSIPIQETLVCPHCKSSYIHTRKIAPTIEGSAGSKCTTGNLLDATGIRDGDADSYPNGQTLQGSRRRPPLWHDPSGHKEVSSPRYPRSKKQSFIVGLILLVIVAMSVVIGAMWQLKGLNPLEALLSWRM